MAKSRKPKFTEIEVREIADGILQDKAGLPVGSSAYQAALVLLQHEGKVKFNFRTKELELV